MSETNFSGTIVKTPTDYGVKLTGSVGPWSFELKLSTQAGIGSQFGGQVGSFSFDDSGWALKMPGPGGSKMVISSDGSVAVGFEAEFGSSATPIADVGVFAFGKIGDSNVTYIYSGNFLIERNETLQTSIITNLETGEKQYINTNEGRQPQDGEMSAWAYCFAAGTLIQTPNGDVRIEDIRVGDEVFAFDPHLGVHSALSPRPVTQLFVSNGQELIDFHGTQVTLGHMFLSADGTFRRLIEILELDGTIVSDDGTVIRARTNVPLDTPEDKLIPVLYLDPGENDYRTALMRAGTPYGYFGSSEAVDTLLTKMGRYGYSLRKDGLFENEQGDVKCAAWEWGSPIKDDNIRPYVISLLGGERLPYKLTTSSSFDYLRRQRASKRNSDQ